MAEPTNADSAPPRHGDVESIPVASEFVTVDRCVVETGRAVVHKTVSERDEVVEALLTRQDITVERVPIGRVVSEVPLPRQEGGLWIIPVVEERLVVEKQLVLKEELHIRTNTGIEQFRQIVKLREENVTVKVEGSAKMAAKPEDTEGE